VANCIDLRDQITQNTLSLSTGPSVNFNGEYTTAQIAVFTEELSKNIAENANNNALTRMTNAFGDGLNNTVSYLNGLFKELMANNLNDYPEIQTRWASGNMTAIEVADFMEAFNYTPQGIANQTDFTKLLRELNNYYTSSFSDSLLGGFCSTMTNIFQKIDAFYDLIGVIDGIITDALAFIQKINEFEGYPPEIAQQGLITFLINQIKQKMEDIAEKVFQEVEDAINNFNVENIIGEFTEGSLASVKAIMTAKEQLCTVLTDENKKSIKDKLKGFVDYAVSLLESPGLEQIRYLVFRFCALAANVEALLKDIMNPLDDYGLRFQRIVRRMEAISNINTSTAIRNGAIRYSPERREEAINRLRAMWDGDNNGEVVTSTGEKPIAVKPITAKEYQELPVCGKVFKSGHKGIKVSGDWVEDLGITGYTRIDLDVKVYLMRLRKVLGKDITITRGWYSTEYNEKVGGDPENSHLSGLVIDIKNDFSFDIPSEDLSVATSIKSIEDFQEQAFKAGFKYIVIKDDEIHLDIRNVPR